MAATYILQVGVSVDKVIHPFGEFHDAFFAIGAFQGGQVNAIEKEFLYLNRVVFIQVLLQQLSGLLGYLCIV